MKLPYLGKFSARIKRNLIKIIKDYRPHLKLCFVSYSSNKIGNLFRKSLGQIPFRYTSNAVYKITCACGQAYIGKTCRRVSDRVREHKDALTKPSRFSHVAEHSKNFGHSIDWSDIKIITKDNTTTKRVIKETLAIGLLKPSMNAMQSSAQLHVFCLAYLLYSNYAYQFTI